MSERSQLVFETAAADNWRTALHQPWADPELDGDRVGLNRRGPYGADLTIAVGLPRYYVP